MEASAVKSLIDQGVKTLIAQLEAGNSEAMTRYLNMTAQFHQYSFGNVMAICRQKPDATRVAGFHTWKSLRRSVRKGEHGIAILAPLVGKKANEETGEKESRLYGFRVVFVFDYSQTDGEPLPECAVSRVTGDPGEMFQKMKTFAESKGIKVEFKIPDEMHGAMGYSQGGFIALSDAMTPAETVATFAHELGHELLAHAKRHGEVSKTCRELEAEAVAYIVSTGIGLETGSSSAEYIQLYQGNAEMLTESLEAINKTAAAILEAVA